MRSRAISYDYERYKNYTQFCNKQWSEIKKAFSFYWFCTQISNQITKQTNKIAQLNEILWSGSKIKELQGKVSNQ